MRIVKATQYSKSSKLSLKACVFAIHTAKTNNVSSNGHARIHSLKKYSRLSKTIPLL
jgi:hypothetical protein